jgi:hypothetical protein
MLDAAPLRTALLLDLRCTRAAARPPPQASASTGASLSLTDVVVAPQPSPNGCCSSAPMVLLARTSVSSSWSSLLVCCHYRGLTSWAPHTKVRWSGSEREVPNLALIDLCRGGFVFGELKSAMAVPPWSLGRSILGDFFYQSYIRCCDLQHVFTIFVM